MAPVERGDRRASRPRPARRSSASTATSRRRRRRARDRRRWRAHSPTSTSTTGAGTTRCASRSPSATASGIDQVALGAGSDEFIVLLARLFAEGGTVATVPGVLVFDVPLRRRDGRRHDRRRPRRRPTSSSSVDRTIRRGSCRTSPTCRANWSSTRPTPTTPASTPSIESTTARSCCERSPRPTGWPARASATHIASPELIDIITSRQAPLSVSSLSASLALAAIATPLDVSAQVAERERLASELTSLGLDAGEVLHELPLHPDGRIPRNWSSS